MLLRPMHYHFRHQLAISFSWLRRLMVGGVLVPVIVVDACLMDLR